MLDMNDPEVIESLSFLIVPKEERIKTSARPFDSRKNFFVPHKTEGYLTAEVVSEDGDNVTLMNSQNEVNNIRKFFSRQALIGAFISLFSRVSRSRETSSWR